MKQLKSTIETHYKLHIENHIDIKDIHDIYAKGMDIVLGGVYRDPNTILLALNCIDERINDKFIKHENLDYYPQPRIVLTKSDALILSKILKQFAKSK